MPMLGRIIVFLLMLMCLTYECLLLSDITPVINTLMGTLKPHSSGPLYSNRVLVDWPLMSALLYLAAAPPSSFLAVPNVTAHPSTASVPTSYYSMWHYKYICTVKSQLSNKLMVVDLGQMECCCSEVSRLMCIYVRKFLQFFCVVYVNLALLNVVVQRKQISWYEVVYYVDANLAVSAWMIHF